MNIASILLGTWYTDDIDVFVYTCVDWERQQQNSMLAITSPLNICSESVQPITFCVFFYPMSSTWLHSCCAHPHSRGSGREREWNCIIVAMSHLEYTWSFKNNLSSFFKENIKLYPMVFPCVAHILLIYSGNKDCPHLCDILVYLGICTLTKGKTEKNSKIEQKYKKKKKNTKAKKKTYLRSSFCIL